jgi:hypothetical protein
MLALTAATEPGPFLRQTIQMGSYFRIRASDGWSVAMAGERLQSTAFVENQRGVHSSRISRPRICAGLVTFLAAESLEEGRTPLLHVKSENGAKVVYQKIGFRLCAAIFLTVISLRRRRGQLRKVWSHCFADSQIHGISDETHSQVHTLLTDHQRELEKAMQQREHADAENPQTVVSVTSTFLHLRRFSGRRKTQA